MNCAKPLCLALLLLFANGNLWSQKEYNVWYFGSFAGIDFKTTPPSSLSNSKLQTLESSSGVCDSLGNLLFYTNGDQIYNRQHRPMRNTLAGSFDYLVRSCVQGTMVLKVPGTSSQYYIFLGLSAENITRDKDSLMRYSIVDMNGDKGQGEVIVYREPLMKGRRENFSVTQHANGFDYWILAADGNTGTFYCTRTVKGKLNGPVSTQKMSYKQAGYSNLKFSPDSRIVYTPAQLKTENSQYKVDMHLYKFDNASGSLSRHVSVRLPVFGGYQAEFSPNSKYLYVEVLIYGQYHIYQYDLSVWDSAAIASSGKSLGNIPDERILGLQLGPDGKIYCFNDQRNSTNHDRLSVIHFPDLGGQSCQLTPNSLKISFGHNELGFPYYPTFKLKNWRIDLGPDTLICKGDSFRLFCYTSHLNIITWSTGDTGRYLWLKKPGMYSVIVTDPKGWSQMDTMNLAMGPKTKVFIGNDTAFCGKFTHLLKSNAAYSSYRWSTGDTVMQITVDSKGEYSLKVTDEKSCKNADTIRIGQLLKPRIKLVLDTGNCQNTFLLTDSIKGLKYFWNTGDTTHTIPIAKKDLYIVTVSNGFCSLSDSIPVDLLAKPQVTLGEDTSICKDAVVIRANEPGKYRWSTGAIGDSIIIHSGGIYWLSIGRNNCISADTVVVKQLEIPIADLGPDREYCTGYIRIGTQEPGACLWNTKETSDSIRISKPSQYWLAITRDQCTNTDTIKITQLPVPYVDLGPDIDLCHNLITLRTAGHGHYLWNTGGNSPSLQVDQPGQYWLTVNNGACLSSDTINVKECEPMHYNIPNGFTPNADGHNDVFRVFGTGIVHIEMHIYYRW